MKKVFTYIVLIVLIGLVYFNREDIYRLTMPLLSSAHKITTLEKNKYYREYDFKYVINTDDFVPETKQDILNIYYTFVNSGDKSFTFHCSDKYINCINDVETLANDQNMISNINNFVHPYNSFDSIETTIDSRDNITLKINKVYDDDMIVLINYKIEEIYKEVYKSDLSTKDNIKNFHDYIINNTRYDKERADSKIVKYKSDNAYGVLLEGIGLCGGYTDTMSLFLEKMHVKNYKVSTLNHTWNRAFIDGVWYHIDLTWDDPISEDGTDILDHKFFLITTSELLDIEKSEHNFDAAIYDK